MTDRTGLARAAILGLTAVMSAAGALVGVATGPDPTVPELTASVEIRRTNQDPDSVSLEVTNHGDGPVTVRSVELVSDSFSSPGPQRVDVVVPAHAAPRDVRARFGEGRCGGEAAPVAAPARAHLEVSVDGRSPHAVELALSHPNGVLDRLLRQRCGIRYLAERVNVTVGEWTVRGDGRVTADLTLRRVSESETLNVARVGGSVLYSLELSEPAPPGLTADDGSGTFTVVGDLSRCDAHGLADVKKPYAFHVWIAVGDREPIAAPIPVSPAAEAAFADMQDRLCEGH